MFTLQTIYELFYHGCELSDIPYLLNTTECKDSRRFFFLGSLYASKSLNYFTSTKMDSIIHPEIVNLNFSIWHDRSRRSNYLNGKNKELNYTKELSTYIIDKPHLIFETEQLVKSLYDGRLNLSLTDQIIKKFVTLYVPSELQTIITVYCKKGYETIITCMLMLALTDKNFKQIWKSYSNYINNRKKGIYTNHCITDKTDVHTFTCNNSFSEQLVQEGYKNIYTPSMSNQRTIMKTKALQNATTLDLLSRTGSSYLANIGNRYRDILLNNIKKHNTKMRFLLLSPWTKTAIITAFSESQNRDIYLNYLSNKYSSSEIINLYINSDWFRFKFTDMTKGYENITKVTPNIELRFIDFDISASVLITDELCFFEPYFNALKNERIGKSMTTFEIEIENTNNLYFMLQEHFHTLWENSISYNDLINKQELYVYKLMSACDNSEKYINHISAHGIIWHHDKFLILKRASTNDYLPNLWDFPGGEIYIYENTTQGLKREIYEETKLNPRIGQICHAYSNLTELPSRKTTQLIYSCISDTTSVVLNPIEHIQYCWITISELPNYKCMPYINSWYQEVINESN